MKINKKHIIFCLIIIMSYYIKSELSILSHFLYMNEDGLLNIYENTLFTLPYLITNIFNILEIVPYLQNKYFIVSRLNSNNKFDFYILKRIISIVSKNCLFYFTVISIITIIQNNISYINVYNIFLCYLNFFFIELFFAILFYLSSNYFSIQNCYLINIITIIFIPASGFLAKYLENEELFNLNFITKNITFNINNIDHIKYNYFIILISLLILIAFIKIKDIDWRKIYHVKIRKYIKKI